MNPSPLTHRHAAVWQAIQAVLGVDFADICSKSRIRAIVYARFIYTNAAFRAGDRITVIARDLGRNHSTALYYLRGYDTEFKFNPKFRAMARAVNNLLKP